MARASQHWYYDVTAFRKIPETQWIDAVVTSAATNDFSASVRMTLPSGASAKGTLRKTKIKDEFVRAIRDELKDGDHVKVRIEQFEHGGGCIWVSMIEFYNYTAFATVSDTEWLDAEVLTAFRSRCWAKVTHPNGKDKATGSLDLSLAGGLGKAATDCLFDLVGVGDVIRVRVLGTVKDRSGWRMFLSTLNSTEDGFKSEEDKGEMVVGKFSVDR